MDAGTLTSFLISNEWVLMGVVFLATVSVVFFIILFLRPAYQSDRAIRHKLTAEKAERTEQERKRQPNRVSLYYETAQNRQQDSLERKLQRADPIAVRRQHQRQHRGWLPASRQRQLRNAPAGAFDDIHQPR